MYDIRFPHLGITFHNLKDGFTIFGFEIKFYGLIIGIGFLLAYFLVISEAKRTKQDTEIYLDFFLWLVIPAILGARLYYIIFNAGEYFEKGKGFGQTIKDLINIRNGGLAIYGGIIAGVITAIIFCRKKKVKFLVLADTISIGLLLGQIIGRWGNFVNQEAFGTNTNSFLGMTGGTIQSRIINEASYTDGIMHVHGMEVSPLEAVHRHAEHRILIN